MKRSVLPVPRQLGPDAASGLRAAHSGQALAATYSDQPILQSERARLRATHENVPAALAGGRRCKCEAPSAMATA